MTPATPILSQGLTGAAEKTIDHARQMAESNKLAADLFRYLKNYRTQDRKELTEGEVIVGLGFLLGQYVKDVTAVQRWLEQVGVAAIDAAKGSR